MFKVKQVVQLNALSGFSDSPAVINEASDILVKILGNRSRHARAAVAFTGLPKNPAVEIQVIFEI